MSRIIYLFSVPAMVAGLALGGGSIALAQSQTDHGAHHPDQPAAAAPKSAPAQGGMMGGGMPGMMGGGMMKGGMMQMMQDCPMMGGAGLMDNRIDSLKSDLGITDVQKAPWEAYVTQLKANQQSMQDMQARMKAMMAAKSPMEHLDTDIAMIEGRLKALKEMKPVLASLYAVLTAEQKTKADQLLTGMGGKM